MLAGATCASLASANAQVDDQALFDFDTLSYLMTARTVSGQMALTLEKYGERFEKAQAALRAIDSRIDSGAYISDLVELAEPYTMRNVRGLLGYHKDIDDSLYLQLHRAIASSDSTAANGLIKELKTKIQKLIETKKAEIQGITLLDAPPFWKDLKASCEKKDGNRSTEFLKPLNAKEMERVLAECGDSVNVRGLLERFIADRKSALPDLDSASTRLGSGGGEMVKKYALVVAARKAEIDSIYAAAKDVWKQLQAVCTDGDQACKERRRTTEKTARAVLADRLRKVKREFNVRSPVGDHPEFFRSAFSDELMGLSQAEEEKRKEAERLAEAQLWRLISILAAAPTPQAGELCFNREISVYPRKTKMHEWIEKRIRRQRWATPKVILIPQRVHSRLWFSKQAAYADPEMAALMNDFKKKRISDPAVIKAKRDTVIKRFWANDKLWETYIVDTLSQDGVMAIVKWKEYYRRLTSRRLRHHVLSSRRGVSVIGSARADAGSVKRAAVKFEDGVIDEIVVTADVRVPVSDDEKWLASRSDSTKLIEVTFTNSNTPIPFTNVWNYYGKFMNRVPLYGYRTQDGRSRFKGTDGVDYAIMLSDVIRYIPELHLGSNNSAPGDTVVHFDFRNVVQRQGGSVDSLSRQNEPEQLCGMLLKDNIRKYGELKVYTDLMGVAKGKPNGLLQSDYSWRLPLWAKRNQGVNYLSIVEPYFGATLRDKEESRLYVGLDSTNGALAPKRELRPLDLMVNSVYNTGMKINLIHLSLRYIKTEIELNAFGYYTRTQLRDSVIRVTSDTSTVLTNVVDTEGNIISQDTTFTIANTRTAIPRDDLRGVGSFTYGAEIRWRFKPDSRFGFDAYGGIANYVLPDEAFTIDDQRWRNRWLFDMNMVFLGLDAHLFNTKEQKFFFRFRWFANDATRNENVTFLQVGYNRHLRFGKGN